MSTLKSVASIGGMLVLNSFVDWKDPQMVWLFRGLFVLVGAAAYLAWQYVGQQVEKNKEVNDASPVWVKKAPGMFDMFTGGDAAAQPVYHKTTIYALEAAAVQKGAPLLNMMFPLVMSLQMNIHLPLGLQVINTPVNTLEDEVFKKYVLNKAVPNPYGELTEDPTAAAGAAPSSQGRLGTAGGEPVSAAAAPQQAATGADAQSEEAVLSVWESKDLVDIGVFDVLVKAGKDVNYRVPSNGWTALHVVAGNPQYSEAEVHRLLALGADPLVVDADDAWTALHWAAFHDCASGIQAICGSYAVEGAALKHRRLGGLEDLAHLLSRRDTRGRTPWDVATGEDNAAAVDALEAAAARAAVPKATTTTQASEPHPEGGEAGEVAGAPDHSEEEEGAPDHSEEEEGGENGDEAERPSASTPSGEDEGADEAVAAEPVAGDEAPALAGPSVRRRPARRD